MTKKELIKIIAKETNLPETKIYTIIQIFLKTMEKSFLRKEPVILRTFGIFKIKHTKKKKGRNPKTGEEVIIPSHKRIKFELSKNIKNKLAKK